MIEPAQPPAGDSDLVELSFDERMVMLCVRPPGPDQPDATTQDAAAVLRRGPRAVVPSRRVAGVVAAQSGQPVALGEVPLPPGATGWFVAISPDELAAYLVPAPPLQRSTQPGDPEVESAPVPISAAEIKEQLPEFRVTHGLLDEVIASFDPPRLLDTIECVARGAPAVEGRDASIEIGLNDEHHAPVVRADGTVDHHATLASRFVEEGAVIAMRVPPVEGTAGVTVTGDVIEPRVLVDRTLERLVGTNTEIQGDHLVAIQPGRPVRSGDRIDVLPSYEVAGDLDYAVGNIEFAGDVFVRGDVRPGFSIVATGSVVVGGMLEHGSIRAGGSISVQGVIGDGDVDYASESELAEPSLEAGGDIDAQYLHTVSVRAAGDIRVNREIVNSRVEGRRVETSRGGRIVGGQVVAELEIAAGSLGSQKGTRTQLHVTTVRSVEPLVVRAWEAAHAGVRLNVSTAVQNLEDDLPAASFWQLEGELVRLDSLSTLPDVIAFAEETGRRPPMSPSEDSEDDVDGADEPAAA